jgi:hypothetical protein
MVCRNLSRHSSVGLATTSPFATRLRLSSASTRGARTATPVSERHNSVISWPKSSGDKSMRRFLGLRIV